MIDAKICEDLARHNELTRPIVMPSTSLENSYWDNSDKILKLAEHHVKRYREHESFIDSSKLGGRTYTNIKVIKALCDRGNQAPCCLHVSVKMEAKSLYTDSLCVDSMWEPIMELRALRLQLWVVQLIRFCMLNKVD